MELLMCGNCIWWLEDVCACCNEESVNYCESTEFDDTCGEWENKDE